MGTRMGKVLPWVRIVLTIASFLATGYLTLTKSLSPPPPATAVIVVTLGAIVVGALLPSIADFRFGRAQAVLAEVEDALRSAFSEMVTSHKFPPADLRLHFFRVRYTWGWRFPPRQKALVRSGYFTLKTRAPLAEVEWAKGKGLIGEVWEAKDISGRAEDVRVPGCGSAAEWDAVDPSRRRNMTWEDAKATSHVEAVFALAVLEKRVTGDVVAVISADTAAEQLALLNKPGVKAFLDVTGRLAWTVVHPPGR